MLDHGESFCHFDATKGHHVLTLKIAPGKYIKLRNLEILPAVAGDIFSPEWKIMGKPPLLLKVKTEDLQTSFTKFLYSSTFLYDEIVAHQKALDLFLKKEVSVQKIFSINDQRKQIGEKLTTEMSPSGDLRVVLKKIAAEGTFKRMYRDKILWEGSTAMDTVVARGKIKDLSTTDATKEEIQLAKRFLEGKVIGSVPMDTAPAGRAEKVRVEMPWMSGGTLESEIPTAPITDKETYKKKLELMYDIATALKGMHDLGYSHNDLKLANCLLDTKTKRAFISDFGSTRSFTEDSALGSTYPAPEYALSTPSDQLFFGKFGPGNDVWALGLCLYAMIYGKAAISFVNNHMYWAKTKAEIEWAAFEILKYLDSKNPVDMILRKTLEKDPTKRPSMEEILADLKKIIDET